LPGNAIAIAVVLEDALLPALPAIKSAAAYNGEQLVLLRPEDIVAFFRLHQACQWLCHRAGLVYAALASTFAAMGVQRKAVASLL